MKTETDFSVIGSPKRLQMAVFVVRFLFSIINLIAALVLIVCTCVHAYNVHSDLFTKQRQSVDQGVRRKKPKLSTDYKLVSLATLGNGVFGSFYVIVYTVGLFSSSIAYCGGVKIPEIPVQLTAKLMMYYVFTIRFHMVYKGSKYDFNPRTLKCVVLILTCYVLFAVSASTSVFIKFSGESVKQGKEMSTDYMGQEWALEHQTGENDIDNHCPTTVPNYFIGLFALFEIVVNIVFCITFILPIRDVIRNVHDLNKGSSKSPASGRSRKSPITKKMLFVGCKVCILSGVQFLSTLFNLLMFNAGVVVTPCDDLINFICLALMTPYYPDDKYYKKVCRLCIRCCDCKGYSYTLDNETQEDYQDEETVISSKDSTNDTNDTNPTTSSDGGSGVSEQLSSVDTMSAFKAGVNKGNRVAISASSNSTSTERELAAQLK